MGDAPCLWEGVRRYHQVPCDVALGTSQGSDKPVSKGEDLLPPAECPVASRESIVALLAACALPCAGVFLRLGIQKKGLRLIIAAGEAPRWHVHHARTSWLSLPSRPDKRIREQDVVGALLHTVS